MIQLCRPLIEAGRIDDARASAVELIDSPDPRFVAFGRLLKEFVEGFAGSFASDRVEESIAFAHEVFDGPEDNLGLAWVAMLEGFAHWFGLHSVAAAEAMARVQLYATAAGDEALVGWTRKLTMGPISAGPTHVDVALVATQAMLAEATDIVGRAGLQAALGKLFAMRGEIDAARDFARRARDYHREAGLLVEAAADSMMAAFIENHAGERGAAETLLREGIAELERLGAHSYRGTAGLDLATVLAMSGQYEEAARLCSSLRETVNEDDLVDIIGLNGLQGFLTAREGDLVEGERLSRLAVELASGIDFYQQKAEAYEWHARTLALAGKKTVAREAASTAVAVYEAKGDMPASAWARELLDSLSD
jgi:hypothetical protein